MHTKLLMTLSAAVMAALGLAASFLPQEILAYARATSDPHGALLIQVTGALYLGFAMLNWMARGNTIGGIYSRPIALGNFLHFVVAAIALLKTAGAGVHDPVLVTALMVYAAFAAWFGLVLFVHPTP
jgi:hypothetical protein